jgi:anti-sigma B factor antagonist
MGVSELIFGELAAHGAAPHVSRCFSELQKRFPCDRPLVNLRRELTSTRLSTRHAWRRAPQRHTKELGHFGYNVDIVTIERRQASDQVVFVVAGRMDAENAPQFEQQCRACIAEGLTGLVVDMGELKYISSMGLRSFVSVGKTLQDKGGALRICRLNGLVKQVFEITGLMGTFLVYESVEAALIGG